MIDSAKIKKIKLIITDVDGVLTDGTFLQGASNIEMKRFCVQDGTAVAMAKTAGLNLAVISGRFSNATEARMKELKIMDMTAITLCKENKLSIGVLSIENENSLLEFINGKNIGTIIS